MEEIDLGQPIIIPDDIVVPSRILDIRFSPKDELICVGDLSGSIGVYSYGNQQLPEQKLRLRIHNENTRNVRFNDGGNLIITSSSDGSIVVTDLNAQRTLIKNQSAHNGGIYALDVAGDIIVSGDEDGCIKVWDTRQRKCVAKHDEHNDYIAQLTLDNNIIFAAGGDGCMSTWNLPQHKVIGISDNLNEDLLSLAISKEGERLVCGGQSGKLFVWNWDDWEYPVHALKGHPESIESIIPIDKNTVITGSSDGILRVVQINPHKLLGCIGQHNNFPIERLTLSKDNDMVASAGHGKHIKFWDVAYLFEDGNNEGDMIIEKPEEDVIDAYKEEKIINAYNKKKRNKGKQTLNETNPFFKDL
ncbi:WD repeat-containing protein [Entamoeba marina]